MSWTYYDNTQMAKEFKPVNVVCAHPADRLEIIDTTHIYCNKCCGHFYLEQKNITIEDTLRLKNERLNDIIKEIQNIIDTNCLGDIRGN